MLDESSSSSSESEAASSSESSAVVALQSALHNNSHYALELSWVHCLLHSLLLGIGSPCPCHSHHQQNFVMSRGSA